MVSRLIYADVIVRPTVVGLSAMSFLIMFGVYFQLFMYVAVVANRYTAIVHPMRHSLVRLGERNSYVPR